MLAEQQVEADRAVESLNAALAADGEALLSPAERAGADAAIAHLQTMRGTAPPNPDHQRGHRGSGCCQWRIYIRRMDAPIRKVPDKNVNKGVICQN